MIRSLFVAFIVLGCALVCAGQQSVSAIDARVDTRVASNADVNPKSPPTANQPDTGAPPSDYVLGPLDVLSIIVLELQDDTAFSGQTFRIDISGDVSLPYAGRVHAAGLTTQELQQQIAASLLKFIKQPDVTVGVAEFHSQPVSLLGEVNTPGEFQVQGRKKLMSALALAGGFTDYVGNTITITRNLEWGRIPLPNAHDDPTGQFSIATMSVKNVLHSKSPEQNIQVMQNDVISISRTEIVYVVGSVNMPGGFPMGQDETLSTLQVLSLAQGPETTAALQKAKIIRLVPGSNARTELPINLKQLLAGQVADVRLQSGDILFVPSSVAKRAGERTVQAIVNAATGAALYGSRF
jgi:polysaccharide biosynthesis/export protein